ncbi:MAG: antibiotic biosynthesis monooxygenase [Rubrobacter sp.]|nr:antibiotic biosynthesis monooxygenase [Rubrobacter sp.]
MIAITNRLPVKEGRASEVVERFAESRGNVQNFPGFVSMEVLCSEDEMEVLVITRWQSREAFDSWVESDSFRQAHSGGNGSDYLSGRPQMGSYEIAVEREPGEASQA